jgi:sugar phosphate isomerase/epimerase
LSLVRPRVLASTTSHKAESLSSTLDVFARLELRDVDLNLHHLIECGERVDDVRRALTERGLRVWVLSGGWCDFFHPDGRAEDTAQSVARQVAMASQLGVSMLRLFFGRLSKADYSEARRDTAADNLRRLSDAHPEMLFVFENHDGASLVPAICCEILERTGRPNIRMNFDPINFERVGVNSMDALQAVRPFVAHGHLKGLERGEYCEFGVGDVDLSPVLRALASSGFAGSFSVEYEGPFDKTVRLYQSIQRARAALAQVGM